MNYKRKSRRRFFLLMRSRTPPISSEFRGGGGFGHPNPPRYATGKRYTLYCHETLVNAIVVMFNTCMDFTVWLMPGKTAGKDFRLICIKICSLNSVNNDGHFTQRLTNLSLNKYGVARTFVRPTNSWGEDVETHWARISYWALFLCEPSGFRGSWRKWTCTFDLTLPQAETLWAITGR